MEPTTAAMIAKAAIAVGTNKKVWTGIASVIAALCLPFILIIVCILSIASGGQIITGLLSVWHLKEETFLRYAC